MQVTVGIRREDKNEWERRVPLVPDDIALLKESHGLRFAVQPSSIRVYKDEEFVSAGAVMDDDLESAKLILAVKEVPVELIAPGTVYVFFAHVAKGQAANMPMLRRFIELGCTLVDYEKIADDQNRRLIFFGRHAGNAGIVETLCGLGKRLAAEGFRTPLAELRHAFAYPDLESAKAHLSALGKQILRQGMPYRLRPLVIGISGYGNVSRGVQEVLDCLHVREIEVPSLPVEATTRSEWGEILKVVFKEEHLVRPADPAAKFDLKEYFANPDGYVGCLEAHLPYLDVLVNAIYWEERYPRLVTREWARRNYPPGSPARLKVIGDISCDIEGSIEFTLKTCTPDSPFFVYEPATGTVRDGISGDGPVVMAVDNLPCEFPRESSRYFSSVLREMVCGMAAADWSADIDRLDLPSHLKRAIIVHKGELTPSYRYLARHMD